MTLVIMAGFAAIPCSIMALVVLWEMSLRRRREG